MPGKAGRRGDEWRGREWSVRTLKIALRGIQKPPIEV